MLAQPPGDLFKLTYESVVATSADYRVVTYRQAVRRPPRGLPAMIRPPTVVTLSTGGNDVPSAYGVNGPDAGLAESAVSPPTNRELWYCGAVEPNGWDAHEIRRTWWKQLHR